MNFYLPHNFLSLNVSKLLLFSSLVWPEFAYIFYHPQVGHLTALLISTLFYCSKPGPIDKDLTDAYWYISWKVLDLARMVFSQNYSPDAWLGASPITLTLCGHFTEEMWTALYLLILQYLEVSWTPGFSKRCKPWWYSQTCTWIWTSFSMVFFLNLQRMIPLWRG